MELLFDSIEGKMLLRCFCTLHKNISTTLKLPISRITITKDYSDRQLFVIINTLHNIPFLSKDSAAEDLNLLDVVNWLIHIYDIRRNDAGRFISWSIQNWRQFVKDKYTGNGKRFESPVVNFSNSREGREFKEDLDTIREIRNLLVHLPMTNGQYPIEPSESHKNIGGDYRKIEHPLKAMDFAIKIENIMKKGLDDLAFSIMKKWKTMDIPMSRLSTKANSLEFSARAQFFVYDAHNCKGIHLDMKIGDFIDILPVEKHRNEYYEFAPKDALYIEIRELFEKTYQRNNRRLAVVFLTSDGKPDGWLQGMITPWDVLRIGEK